MVTDLSVLEMEMWKWEEVISAVEREEREEREERAEKASINDHSMLSVVVVDPPLF